MKSAQRSLLLLVASMPLVAIAQSFSVSSPDKKINVTAGISNGAAWYKADYQGRAVLLPSSLGLVLEDANFAETLSVTGTDPVSVVKDHYTTHNAKKSDITYLANKRVWHLQNNTGNKLDIIFQVSNDGIAFRYYFPGVSSDIKKVTRELTSYHFVDSARAWTQPMAVAKSGWEKSNPSYEENYLQDVPAGTPSPMGAGWIYPALFRSNNTWVLISETAMDGSYCGTRLKADSLHATYNIDFPDPREVFTGGGLLPQHTLPWSTPWRIIALGSLKTIAESTLGTDLANPAIKIDPSFIKPGKASWSWIMSKDDSIVYDIQHRYIDFAADMKWQYCLVDADWDTRIGYEKIKELADYATTKNVGLLLWYNSAGAWNTTPYHPRNMLLTRDLRQREFSRLQAMGIKGVKVDFFGGDGQSMIQYYVDILEDAAKYKLLVNFHGATLPRGWQRTYPHLLTTEAVKGFEMVTFGQKDADLQPNHCAMLPFTRNAFDPMDFTPINLYKVPRIQRRTTSGYELALSVLFLSGIQHYAESPQGMSHVPAYVKSFLQTLPDYWDDVKFIDGFPGKLAVIARRSGKKWYVSGINGEAVEKKLALQLGSLKAHKATIITDGTQPLSFTQNTAAVSASGVMNLTVQPNGGFVIVLE
ncbi:MAG: glycoside hydrolase family 97 catalytic domain-containing protein [Chitinophagaceae bacterium]